MKCCALLLSLLLCLGLTGCAPAEVEIPAMPVQAAEAAEAEEPAAEELKETDKSAGAEKTAGAEQVLAGTGAGNTAEREPEPERASAGAGADVLLFGVTAPTLETADGTRFVSAELFADGGHLILQESENAAVLCRMGERLRLAADGTQALWQDGELWIDGVRAAERFGLLTGETEDGVLYFARPQNTDLPTPNVNVPILMYHAVGDETWGYSDLFVRPSELENHLQYLADNGYETIFFDDLSHLEDYEKPVILTFDDGYDDNYTELYPLLQKYQAKATIFVIPRDLGKAHKMTAEQIQELAQSGLVSIQSHTWSHGNLGCMDEATLIFEMEHSRDAITALTGEMPSVVCYPEGTRSDLSIAVARRYYQYGLLMNGYTWNTSDDPFYVTRMYIPRGQWSIQWNVEKAGTSDPWR